MVFVCRWGALGGGVQSMWCERAIAIAKKKSGQRGQKGTRRGAMGGRDKAGMHQINARKYEQDRLRLQGQLLQQFTL
jgi:hypothetical protein